jgi:heptose I phosphotransferase
MHLAHQYQPIFREVGLDAEAIFSHPDIHPWRVLEDRENCTLDVARPDGSPLRFHIKRFRPASDLPAEAEVRGLRLLRDKGIPTPSLVGWGSLADRRSFVITEDLAGYRAADKLIQEGVSFDRLLAPCADLAAQLHAGGLHHRDLYLCHFFARVEEDTVDVRLIDAARVRPLGFLPQRWIVKDLAQFWYSTLTLPITSQQRDQWLARYAAQRKLANIVRLRRGIERKSDQIARHDRELRKRQPNRNISIPRA